MFCHASYYAVRCIVEFSDYFHHISCELFMHLLYLSIAPLRYVQWKSCPYPALFVLVDSGKHLLAKINIFYMFTVQFWQMSGISQVFNTYCAVCLLTSLKSNVCGWVTIWSEFSIKRCVILSNFTCTSFKWATLISNCICTV